MTELDKQMEDLILDAKKFKAIAVEMYKDNAELRCQVEHLRKIALSWVHDQLDGTSSLDDELNEINLTPVQCLNDVKANTAIVLAGIFHDGEYRIGRAMLICEDYAKKLRE